MKKAILLIGLLIVGLISAGIVFAHGFSKGAGANGIMGNGMMGQGMMGSMMNGMGNHHEEMSEIMETGTYQDLVDYREESEFNIVPWVENEKDFKLAQQMHQKMSNWNAKNGNSKGHCPMMS